jgi:hypothetical protein
MLKHQWFRFLGALLVMGAMFATLPGCGEGGGGAGTAPPPTDDGTDPTIFNPSPESLEPESGEMDY